MIDTPEKDYIYFLSDWEKARDAKAGQRAIHEGGTRYLPMLGGQESDAEGKAEYSKFKARTPFYGATKITIKAFLGLLMHKPAALTYPEQMQDFINDCSKDDKTLLRAVYYIADEVLTVGRIGCLVDYPENSAGELSLAEFEAQKLRPYIAFYPAETILETRKSYIQNESVLSFVKLKETYTIEIDEFQREEKDQIKILDLTPDGYRQRIFRQDKEKKYYMHSETYPKMNGQPIKKIPFFIFSEKFNDVGITPPPLIDLIDLNLNHYQFMASYAHGVFYTGFPTPFLFGVSNNETPKGIGPNEMWTSTNSDAKAGMLEFTGAGLSQAREYLEDRKNEMASLGARFLGSETKKTETAEKTRLDQFGESASLSTIADSISFVMTKLIKFVGEWLGLNPDDISFQLAKDYLPANLSPEMLKSLSYALQSGQISYETFFYNLKRGDIIEPTRTKDDELDSISASAINPV